MFANLVDLPASERRSQSLVSQETMSYCSAHFFLQSEEPPKSVTIPLKSVYQSRHLNSKLIDCLRQICPQYSAHRTISYLLLLRIVLLLAGDLFSIMKKMSINGQYTFLFDFSICIFNKYKGRRSCC
jgi:hypothetical protein